MRVTRIRRSAIRTAVAHLAVLAVLVPLDGRAPLSARAGLGLPAAAAAQGPIAGPSIASASYEGSDVDDVLYSAQTDRDGNLYLFAHVATMPGVFPNNTTIVPAEDTPDPNNFCVVRKRTATGEPLWDVYFEGFSLCEAMGVSPGGTVYLGMQSRASNLGGFAQLVMIQTDLAGAPSIGGLNNGGIGTIPGRPTNIIDIEATDGGDVYVLYEQLVNADSELQGRLVRFDAQGVMGPAVDIGLGGSTSSVALALDGAGKAFVAGVTTSLATTPGAFQPTPPTEFGCTDGFLARVDLATMAIDYATYLGGTGCDAARDVVVGEDGGVYVYGTTTSEDFPMPATALHPYAGGWNPLTVDGLIVKLDLAETGAAQLVEGTFLGVQLGDRNIGVRDSAHPLLVLPGGEIALTGTATASTFPLLMPVVTGTTAPGLARFVQVYAGDLRSLLFSTHLDETGAAVHSVIASPGGQALYAITQTAEDGRGTDSGYNSTALGGTDLLVIKLLLSSVVPPVNTAPTARIDPMGPLVATSPLGAQAWIMANVADADADPLDATLTGPFGTRTISVMPPYYSFIYNASSLERLPIGTSTLELRARDPQGLEGVTSALVVVNGINTLAGSAQVVNQVDDNFQVRYGFTPGRMRFTFDTVAAEGLTYFVTRTDQAPPPPAGKQMGSSPFYYDVATTATVAGDVRVCIDTTGMSFASAPALYRLDGGSWLNVSVPPSADEAAASLVCGVVHDPAQLTTFALFTDADQNTLVTTIAGSGEAFAPGTPAPGDGGFATVAPVGFPEAVAFDATRNVMYVGDTLRIRRVDLATNRIATIAGTGDVAGSTILGADARQSAITVGGIAVDSAGNVFFGDINGCGVMRVDVATNNLTRVAGHGPDPVTLDCGSTGDGGLAADADVAGVARLAFDPEGNLYFTQLIRSPTLAGPGAAIRRIAAGADHLVTGGDPDELIATVAGGGTEWFVSGINPRDALIEVQGMAFNSRGDLYVGGLAGVHRITPAPGRTTIDGDPGERIATVAGALIQVNAPFQGDGGPARDANFANAFAVAILPNGDLVVSDTDLGRIRLVTTGGDGVVDGIGDERISTIAGFSTNSTEPPVFSGDGYALATTFGAPRGLAADPRGGVAVADSAFNRVRRIGLPLPGAANHAPVANAGPDQTVVSNGFAMVVQLDATGSSDPDGDALTYEWRSGSLVVSNDPQINVLQQVGGRTYTLTVTDPSGASSTDTVAVSVVVGADLSITATAAPNPIQTEQTLTYAVAVRNNGPGEVSGVFVTMTVENGVEVLLPELPPGCAVLPPAQGGLVRCDFSGPMSANVTWSFTVKVRPTLPGPLTTTFTIVGDVPDPAPLNNFAAAGAAVSLVPRVIELTEVIHLADADETRPAVMVPVEETIVVSDTSVPTAAVMIPVEERITVSDADEATPIGGVILVPDVFVRATDATGVPAGVWARFPAIERPGVLTADIMGAGVPPITGYTLLSPVFDVRSTAVLPPLAVIVVAIDGSFPADAVMLHFENGAWRDVTTACGTLRACGQVSSLSPFVVARPIVAVDTTPPVVTAPAAITLPATVSTGARSADSAAFASFLAGGSATDNVDATLARLDPLVNGVPVTPTTVFRLGATTTVTFRFRDTAGNIGTATSTVTVFLGTPRLAVRVVGNGTIGGTRQFVDLEIVNTGDGHARSVSLDLVTAIPLSGRGIPKVIQPPLPVSLGSIDAGAAKRVRVVLDVPAGVTSIALTEGGRLRNVRNTLALWLDGQKIVP